MGCDQGSTVVSCEQVRQSVHRVFAVGVLIGTLVCGASSMAELLPEPPAPTPAPENDEAMAMAEMSLALAEVAVAHARAEKALWTTAFDALQQARASRRRGDVAATLEATARARDLCDLSIGQLAYPPEKQ